MMSNSPSDNADRGVPVDGRRTVGMLLRELLARHPEEDIVLGDILAFFGDRAFGALMLALALPMATPLSAIPGISAVFGFPLVIVAAQLMLGFRRPTLPEALARRTVRREALARAFTKAEPWLQKIERAVHPRLPMLTGPTAERVIGLVAVVMAMLLALPIPGANQPPAFAVALFAVGILERDGVFAILGALASLVSLAIIVVIYGTLLAGGIALFGKLGA